MEHRRKVPRIIQRNRNINHKEEKHQEGQLEGQTVDHRAMEILNQIQVELGETSEVEESNNRATTDPLLETTMITTKMKFQIKLFQLSRTKVEHLAQIWGQMLSLVRKTLN